ncbi:hypothetical protein E2C01_029991 [Portunus trituberculatus]|uniref:Uncharacterized protein n=1 Tax=Portunus trituberculatus TaxID=210409 RepID=A0A5B7ETX5_PORTR|nr:hypothetical protein [Portunus trituberculatus]
MTREASRRAQNLDPRCVKPAVRRPSSSAFVPTSKPACHPRVTTVFSTSQFLFYDLFPCLHDGLLTMLASDRRLEGAGGCSTQHFIGSSHWSQTLTNP